MSIGWRRSDAANSKTDTIVFRNSVEAESGLLLRDTFSLGRVGYRSPFGGEVRAVEENTGWADKDALIPLAKGAEMLGLDPSTIRKRKADTQGLTIVQQGKNFFLVLGEVIAHRAKKIEDARRQNDVIRLVR